METDADTPDHKDRVKIADIHKQTDNLSNLKLDEDVVSHVAHQQKEV